MTPSNKQPIEDIRKNLILRAAQKLFLKKGFSSTSTREIAKGAGVSLGNLYNYFASKEEIFDELIKLNAPTREVQNLIKHLESPEFPANFVEIIRRLKEIVSRNSSFIRLSDIDGIEFGGKKTQKIILQGVSRVWLPMEESYQKHLRRGLVREFNPRIGLPLITLCLFAVFVVRDRFNVQGLLDKKILDDEKLLKELSDIFLLGILPRKK